MVLRANSIALAFVWFMTCTSACLADEASDWLRSLKETPGDPGMQSAKYDAVDYSDQIKAAKNQVQSASPTVNNQNQTSLRSHAESKLKDGLINEAIKLVEQAIEMKPEDCVARQIYADALEHKMESSSACKKDPHLFNICVKQWYYVYKNSEYPDMVNVAGEHLRMLTGKSPYVWPTAKMYLGRVLKPETTEEQSAGSTDLAVERRSIAEEPPMVH